MAWPDFFIILGVSAACAALCRVLPLLALSRRSLDKRVESALRMIPAACFAALIANDLFEPAAFANGVSFAALLPFIAAVPVVIVSLRTRSLFLSVGAGLAAYAALFLLA
jgi:branched-subunit amino acid transport protein